MGVADIDDGLGLDCQTSFNGLGAKGVYREVLIINFTPINSLSLPLILWFILGWGRKRLDQYFELTRRQIWCKIFLRRCRCFEAAVQLLPNSDADDGIIE